MKLLVTCLSQIQHVPQCPSNYPSSPQASETLFSRHTPQLKALLLVFTGEEKCSEENLHRLSPSVFLPLSTGTLLTEGQTLHCALSPASCHCPWGHHFSGCPCSVPAAVSSMNCQPDPTSIQYAVKHSRQPREPSDAPSTPPGTTHLPS